ncbi:MAG TPA: MEDS domain-containing protein [Anaeromyxobacteraceae bacterium]|nr:MEDS domain-containing protein [Anaeromyxobacteraceae bacterium]
MLPIDGGRRDSGIGVVGDLPWGSHFCQFYATREDLADIVVPYLRAGLEGGELCVWVTTELTNDEALARLGRGVPRFQEHVAKGQVQVVPHTEWYLRGGRFELKRTIDLWMAKHDEALAKGFTGLRVTGSPSWIDGKEEWDDFAAYEAEINRVIHGARLLVLCTYSLARCGVAEILDVVRNHEFALARNRGAWQVIRMPDALPVVTPACAACAPAP